MRSRCLSFVWLALWSATLAPADEPAVRPEIFRIGISYDSFGTVSRNDARAALKAWAITVVKERKLDATVQIEVFDRESDLRDALARQILEAVSMTAEEFAESGLRPDSLFLTAKDKNFTEQYVVVVHGSGGIEDLPALKGRKLVRHVSPTTSVALPWLETMLAGRSLGRAEKFLGEVMPLESPSKSVLRVFFRQSDACLVTSNAFALACELNPQLRRDLRVLLASPPLIPSLFFFRPGYSSPSRAVFEAAILQLHSSSAGQQVLTIFQGSRFEKQPLSCFDTTRQLFQQYHQLLAAPTREIAPVTTARIQAATLP